MKAPDFNWKVAFSIFCLLLLFANFLLLLSRFRVSGSDSQIYYGAVKAWENGNNPYLLENIKQYSAGPFTFVYPPISIPFFKILHFGNPRVTYYLIWTIALVCTIAIIARADKKSDLFLLTVLLVTGFLATYWNYLTGNVGLIELLLFAMVFYGIIKEKYLISAVFLPLTAVLKIAPLLYATLFVYLKSDRVKIIKILATIFTLFVLISGLSYVLHPNISSTYYLSITGHFDQQHSPLYETGGVTNPSSLTLIRAFLERLLPNYMGLSILLYVLFIAVIIVMFYIFLSRGDRNFLEIFSIGVLAIMLILPRLKPFSFVFALLPLYFLTKNLDYKHKTLLILLASALPLVFYFSGDSWRLFWSPNLLVSGLWNYNQLLLLIAVFAFLIWTYSGKATAFTPEALNPDKKPNLL